MISIDEAVYFLMPSARNETLDRNLNAAEVSWVKEGKEVAFGQFHSSGNHLVLKIEDQEQLFSFADATRLRKMGVVASVKEDPIALKWNDNRAIPSQKKKVRKSR